MVKLQVTRKYNKLFLSHTKDTGVRELYKICKMFAYAVKKVVVHK